jgi:type IV secretion system protein VirB10
MSDDSPPNTIAPEDGPEHDGPHGRDDPHGRDSTFGDPMTAVDRGMPDLGQQRGRSRAWWLMPLAILAVVVAGAVWTIHGFLERHDAAEKARRDALQDQPAQGRVFGNEPASSTAVPASAAKFANPAPASETPTAPAPGSGVSVHAAPARSYYDAPLLTTGGADSAAGASPTAVSAGPSSGTPDAQAGAGPGSARQGQSGSPLGQALVPTPTPRVRAGLLGDRSLVLAQGAKIDCAGDTAFDSTDAGISSCTVTKNVYSDDGRVVLIERGSQINSEYRSNLSPGQKRVFILSARIETPQGVTVQIDSPAADGLGRMGVGGYVNNHWGERIGAALLLSVTQDAIGYLATRGGNSNGSVVFENTEQSGNDMAARVLDSTINIPPTLTQNQGAEFTIVLARDLDFGAVYALVPGGNR